MLNNPLITDAFGRRFPYLRLSLTDVCNFSCSYCLPDGYQKTKGDCFMSADEIRRLVTAFAALGIWKIRLTGGEPTVRKDFVEIANIISTIPGIKKLAVTTNGYKLPERAASYAAAGISAINISIDSLQPQKFKDITGHDRLEEVLQGVDACFDAGIKNIKINTVLLKGINDCELDDLFNFVANKRISLRFIELMRTIDNHDYFNKHHLSGTAVTNRLQELGWQEIPRSDGAGPAVEFTHPQSVGNIGVIAPYSKDFCKTCNRLRVSAKGDLQLCLFGEGGNSLRHLLQDDNQQHELEDAILSLMQFKPLSHFLHQGNSGTRAHLASIGG